MAIIACLSVLLGFEKSGGPKDGEIDYTRLTDYKLGQALFLLGLMVAYALLLRPLGFLLATGSFLIFGALLLGERRYVTLIAVAVVAAGSVWYLVQEVLGIFLSPWPMMMGG